MCSKRKYNVLIIGTKLEKLEKPNNGESGSSLVRFYNVSKSIIIGDVRQRT